MFDIPTRSNIDDELYQMALEQEQTKRQLENRFRELSQDWPVRKNAVLAVKNADGVVRGKTSFSRAGRRHLEGVIPAEDGDDDDSLVHPEQVYDSNDDLPSSIEDELDAEMVLDEYRERIDSFTAALDEALDGETAEVVRDGTLILKSGRDPTDFDFDWLSPIPEENIRIYRSEEGILDSVKSFFSGGNAQSRDDVQYNPLELARHGLDVYSEALEEAAEEGTTETERIRNLYSVVEEFDSSPYRTLVDTWLFNTPSTTPWKLETEEGTEPYRLREENERIREQSDIAISFHEEIVLKSPDSDRWTTKTAVGTASDLGDSYSFRELVNRQKVRDRAETFLEENGEVVFNGTHYTRRENRYSAADEPEQVFVNLLGEPVASPKGTVQPEDWAVEERELVEAYRNDSDEAVEQIVEEYDMHLNGAYTEDEEEKRALEQIEHSL